MTELPCARVQRILSPLSFFPRSLRQLTLTDDELCLSGKINELLIIEADEPNLSLDAQIFLAPRRHMYTLTFADRSRLHCLNTSPMHSSAYIVRRSVTSTCNMIDAENVFFQLKLIPSKTYASQYNNQAIFVIKKCILFIIIYAVSIYRASIYVIKHILSQFILASFIHIIMIIKMRCMSFNNS